MSSFSNIISNLNCEIIFSEKKIDFSLTYWVVTLNRPQALNALNLSMVRALRTILQEFDASSNVAFLIIHGNGERSFCAGGDVKSIAEKIKQDYSSGIQMAEDFFNEEYALDYEIATSSKPIIIWAHGLTLGGGIGLLQASPWSVAETNVQLAMPELKIGFFPDVGSSYYLPRLKNYVGIWLAMTGINISAKDAYAADWIKYLSDISFDQAQQSISVHWNKDLSLENNLKNWLQNLRSTHEISKNLLTTEQQEWCEKLLSSQSIELFYNWMINNQHPLLKAAQENIRQSSPLSLMLTQYLLQQGQHLSLSQALKLEKQAAQFIIENGDFVQGVSERLINKNRDPIDWNTDSRTAEILMEDWKKTLPYQ